MAGSQPVPAALVPNAACHPRRPPPTPGRRRVAALCEMPVRLRPTTAARSNKTARVHKLVQLARCASAMRRSAWADPVRQTPCHAMRLHCGGEGVGVARSLPVLGHVRRSAGWPSPACQASSQRSVSSRSAAPERTKTASCSSVCMGARKTRSAPVACRAGCKLTAARAPAGAVPMRNICCKSCCRFGRCGHRSGWRCVTVAGRLHCGILGWKRCLPAPRHVLCYSPLHPR